jgi:hypothetical protein
MNFKQFSLTATAAALLATTGMAYANEQATTTNAAPTTAPLVNYTPTPVNTLETKTGHEIGVTLSHYRYNEEDGNNSHITSRKMGFDYTYSWKDTSDIFAKFDFRMAAGKAHYSSNHAGTQSYNRDWYSEVRVLAGKDIHVDSYVLAPYAGLGYRHLLSDSTGLTSTGAEGAELQSNYFYLPIGVTHRMELPNNAQLVTTFEYDYLIEGEQTINFSEQSIGLRDAKNTQNSGYGMKLSSMYKTEEWAFGPYLTYWNIEKSDTVRIAYGTYFTQPKNETTEMGVRVSYAF